MSAASELADSLADETLTYRRAFLDLPNGLHHDVSEDVYHAPVIGVASSSSLSRVLRSPAHYLASLDEHRETAALFLGRAIHCYLLEPERFARTYVVSPECDKRTKEGKAIFAAFKASLGFGAIILRPEEHATVLGIARSVDRHPTARRLLAGGRPEVTAKWECRDTGLICRARADFYHADLGIIVDVKSTDDARDYAFGRTVQAYGYHRQEAHYVDGFREVGAPAEDFVFIVCEKEAPYAIAVYQLDAGERDAGMHEVIEAKRIMAGCLARNEWPSYPSAIQRISRPEWARKSKSA